MLRTKGVILRISDEKTIQIYYQALLNRDPAYVGIYFVGVKTTSVFCIATCRARKPKAENVEFFRHFSDALNHGYRPCKVCKPTENAHQAPVEVAAAIKLVRENPKEKISDSLLRAKQISPEKVRRWFNRHYGITFQKFQRMYRINNAYQELHSGKRVIGTALESGYDSLSGFNYAFKKLIGKAPVHSRDSAPIVINRFTSPLGPMFACATQSGLCLLEFVDRRMLETEFKDLQSRLQVPIVLGENPHLKQAQQEIKEYFLGERKTFTVALDTPGTAFQQRVWQALGKIPYGETASYQAQADNINQPTAVRAVARANGDNRVAIIIPCHRVIGKNGNLTGYGGGLARKRWLLEHERVNKNC